MLGPSTLKYSTILSERILGEEISLKYIHTSDQPANALTKPLGHVKFQQHKHSLGILSLENQKKDPLEP